MSCYMFASEASHQKSLSFGCHRPELGHIMFCWHIPACCEMKCSPVRQMIAVIVVLLVVHMLLSECRGQDVGH